MRFDLATVDFVYGGRPRPRFPLLTGDDLAPLEPFHSFLVEELLDSGSALKPLTWEAYGRRIWDYACFLYWQKRDWRPDHGPTGMGPVIAYRDWARSAGHGVRLSTLNDRLSVIVRFYRWAQRTGRISVLPFSAAEIRLDNDSRSFEYHQPQVRRRGLKPTEFSQPLAFLTRDQVAEVRRTHLHPTHALMFEMAGRVGLRSSEIRTLPANSVFDPTKTTWLKPSSVVKMTLDPAEMELKFDKGRVVDVPYSLMQEMHRYKTTYRGGMLRDGGKPETLLVTANGRSFSKDAVVEAFMAISRAVGFPVRAHVMRHTFAVYFLLAVQKVPDYEGNPLSHLMNQLGHSRVESVMVYLRHIGEASLAANQAIHAGFDDIFAA